MAITILAPAPLIQDVDYDSSSDSGSDGGADLDGDLDMRPKKRARRAGSTSIVTPGEVVTDDPQWMRYGLLLLNLRHFSAKCPPKSHSP